MVCIIDYNSGNSGSIFNMFKHIDIEAVVSSDYEALATSSHLVLPGVGSFDSAITKLNELNLVDFLSNLVLIQKKPILGICLGAQIMLDRSEEGKLNGLCWVHGDVIKFGSLSGCKIPHMGWNTVTEVLDDIIFRNMPEDRSRFYFVHSYHFSFPHEDYSTATTTYGYEFSSAFRKENIFGVQFHPEKSHKFGMQLFKNFVRYA